ncbi:hypothetical protein MPDQ_004718 [Monascus purpureus]|uniref:Cell wall mannoprotein 1 n=1 Tax=Monascus purpureus TaxID=5098 RepID=A0A507QJK9_MONPU|nr:hypothetical protein MPDQ_004718 [Monascus purpureus]BDD61227.1 hypothetical protein MAP00_006293 [Monascus purpureus]
MKFTTLLTLGLAAGAMATPTKTARQPSLVERDVAAVTSVLSAVQGKVQSLDTAIKGWNGGAIDSVLSASDDVVSTINDGVNTIKGSGELSTSDALSLPGPVNDLTDVVKTTIDDLNAKKDQVEKACAVPATQDALKKQYDAAKDLSDTIVSKVPESLASIAQNLAAGITDAIQKGINAYQDAKNADSCSASSSSSAGGSTSTAAPTGGAGGSPSSSSAVVPTASSSAVPPPAGTPGASSTPVVSPTGGASTPAVPTPTSPLFNGAADRAHIGYTLGGAVAIAAIAAAF